MNIVSTLACHDFLKLEVVLGYDVGDVFTYLQYLQAKTNAEVAEHKFQTERDKMKRRK